MEQATPDSQYFVVKDSSGTVRGKFDRESKAPIEIPDKYAIEAVMQSELSDIAVNWDDRLIN